MKNAAPLLILAFLLGAGCKHNPIERLADPNPSGARPFPATGGVYTIYDDELKTGGGLGFIPGGENQTIDLLSSGGEIVMANEKRNKVYVDGTVQKIATGVIGANETAAIIVDVDSAHGPAQCALSLRRARNDFVSAEHDYLRDRRRDAPSAACAEARHV
jgi:hypothetical protein